MVSREEIRRMFKQATGHIRYGYRNNYMFIHLLEENLDVLKALVCALLHIRDRDEVTIKVMNPVNMPDDVEGKTYILDIEVLLCGEVFLDLEMQVSDRGDYELRSLQYLCRGYDNLMRGEDYGASRRAVHIGFLDYDLFRDGKEFYASYKLMNEKTHRIYTDRFDLRIVSMNRISLATEEDKRYGIDRWARIFKATTWEGARHPVDVCFAPTGTE